MAKKDSGREADGCPAQSVELPGKIITAAKSTMAEHSYEKGYPELKDRLKMQNVGGKKQ